MAERTAVVNISGDHEETIVQLARHLGTSKIRRVLFNTVYGRGSRARSRKQIMAAAKIKDVGSNGQQVQNELDHLCKHHLVVRVENGGAVKDGSRYLYKKDPTIRANKERIIKLADNRRAADRIPTKRRPVISSMRSIRKVTRESLKKKKPIAVLYLTANPDARSPLRLDVEVSRVQDAIRASNFRDKVRVEYRPAANLNALIKGLNDHRPQIVHFSGHGDRKGIDTDNAKVSRPAAKFLSFDLLASALAATDTPPEIVVLNSCHSSGGRKKLLNSAKVIISMRESVSDVAATVFATNFYAAIASGQSVKAAFAQGKVAVDSAAIGETRTPELLCAKGVNPANLVLV